MILENPLVSRLTRRDILKGVSAAILSGSFVYPACQEVNRSFPSSESQVKTDVYTDHKLRQLGLELSMWMLENGVQMSVIFPEIRNAANLLYGTIDPREFFPYAGIPIGLADNPPDEMAAMVYEPAVDLSDQRRVIVKQRDGQSFELPLLRKDLRVKFKLSPTTLSNSVRFPIICKEASQLLDYVDYARLYLLFLQKNGVSFSLDNPKNIPISDSEFITSTAVLLSVGEIQKNGTSLFSDLVDIGSHIRVGGIAFANWYIDQRKTAGKLAMDKDVERGIQVVDFLFKRGLIKQEGGMMVWTSGQAPGIGSGQFADLFNEFRLLLDK